MVCWSGARRRSLFAVLALRPGRLMSRSLLIDALWGEAPPATAVKTLQGHVARVRQALAAAGLTELLATRDPGYLLEVDPARVDAHRFDEHVRAGRRALECGEPGRAVEWFRVGLALWRGDPLADCPVAGWADAEIARLHEARALAEEHWAEAMCLAGRHAETVAELERLVVRYPIRERLWELLMLALHRSGRRADALLTYRRVRSVLVNGYGIEPGAELRQLEAAMLAGDPRLDPAA